MISKEEIEKMNIAFDFSRQYTIARVPKVYRNAEQFALEVVYSLRPYISDTLGIDYRKVILIAVSKNNKVVVFCENNRYRNWLYNCFHQPSVGNAQFYDNTEPELILEKLNLLFH